MRKYYIVLLFPLHILLSFSLFVQDNGIPVGDNNISENIYGALSLCYEGFSETPLQLLYEILEDDYVKTTDRKFKYWQSYEKMYIYTKDASDLEKSIEIMDTLGANTSEELAFLAFLKSFKMSSIKNKNELKIIPTESKKLKSKALELDRINLSAHYVLAVLEYYNPKSDKKKVKNYLDEGLRIIEKSKDYYDVIWGRNLLYELYIKYYLKDKKIKEAKKIYKKA
jgi:hypothetical protein